MRISIKSTTLLFVSLLLASCGIQTPEPSTTPAVSIVIQSGELVPHPITKDFVYDHCSFDVPMDMTITFGQVLSETFTKELTLQFGADLGVDIPTVVEASIKAGIEEHFMAEKKYVNETEQVASFTIPAHSYQIYTVTLTETLREGELSFTYNGETHGAHYSYRVNLEGTGSTSRSLDCPSSGLGTEMQPATPAPTVVDTCGDGFDASVWNPVSTDVNFFPIKIRSCWYLENYGMTMSGESISILEDDWGPKASWYGVTRPIPTNSSIYMSVHLEKFKGAQIWIGFVDSPSSIDNGKFLAIKLADKSKPGYISAFSVLERKAGVDYPMFDNVFVPFDNGNYSISMKIDTNRLSLWLNNSPKRAFPIFEVSQQYLFIGYLSTTQIDLDVRIDNISIRP